MFPFLNTIFLITIVYVSYTYSCPSWTITFNNKCYLVPYDAPYGHENTCNCYGGHIATIENAIENQFMNNLTDFNFLGLFDVGHTRFLSNGSFAWVGAKPLTYSNWAKGHPNSNSTCAYMNNSLWYTDSYEIDSYCFKNYFYSICEIPKEGLFCPRPTSVQYLSGYWTYFDGLNSCYRSDDIQHIDINNFTSALDNCNHSLLAIRSDQEMKIFSYYLVNLVNKFAFNVWVGIYDPYKNGSWQWSDGSPVNYTNWAPGEPKNVGVDDCAVFTISVDSILWKSWPCSKYAHGICQIPAKLQNDQTMPDVCGPVLLPSTAQSSTRGQDKTTPTPIPTGSLANQNLTRNDINFVTLILILYWGCHLY